MHGFRRRRVVFLLYHVVVCSAILSQHVMSEPSASVDDDDGGDDDRLDLDILDEILATASRPPLEDELIPVDTPVSAIENATESGISNTTATETLVVEEIAVKSNLDSMTDEELMALCRERGFDVKPDVDGAALTHDDYVKAAKRCVTLEDEMNAIIAENPELAAELGDEIERMRAEKERLEVERDRLLAEKVALEAKLQKQQSDSHNAPSGKASDDSSIRSRKTKGQTDQRTDIPVPSIDYTTENDSVEEVLRHSFVLLFDRVGKDLRLVGGVLRVAFKPIGQGLDLMWRYTSPTIEGLIQKTLLLAEKLIATQQASLILRALSTQGKLVKKVVVPVYQSIRGIAMSTIILPLQRRPEIQKVVVFAEAFIGPLGESLTLGWKSVEPDLVDMQGKARKWLQRVIKDRNAQSSPRLA